MANSILLNDAPKRLSSIDAFRALNMLCMIFINDLSGVKGIPSWMDHARQMEDSMGFADTIFPAFLFIVGLSIPLAIDRQRLRSAPTGSITFHILSRSFALLAMGFFHVNMESYSSVAILPRAVWEILITVAFFLIWIDYPDTISQLRRYLLVGSGCAVLVLMAILYKGSDGAGEDLHGMRPEWWGILGMIGWSYMVCAFIYFLVKGNFTAMIIAFIIFIGFNIVDHSLHLRINIPAIYDGSSITLVLTGILISLWYARMASKGYHTRILMWLSLAGCAGITAGLLIRPYAEGISKIRATPAWVLICSGISILMFGIMIYLVDFRNKKHWFSLIWPAGTAALTCYLIPYFLAGLYDLFHFRYPLMLNHGIGGFLRSWVAAFFVVIIGGLLERKRIKLKL